MMLVWCKDHFGMAHVSALEKLRLRCLENDNECGDTEDEVVAEHMKTSAIPNKQTMTRCERVGLRCFDFSFLGTFNYPVSLCQLFAPFEHVWDFCLVFSRETLLFISWTLFLFCLVSGYQNLTLL